MVIDVSYDNIPISVTAFAVPTTCTNGTANNDAI